MPWLLKASNVGDAASTNLALAQTHVPPDSFQSHRHPIFLGDPMDDDLVRRVAGHPQYVELKAKRTRFGWILTLLMLLVYYGFVLLVAFNKPFLAQRMGEGVMTLGIPIGFGVIVFTVAITAYYVKRANAEFDMLSEAVAKGALK
jgi:uncharacterized membrane protein (DUF485 family)